MDERENISRCVLSLELEYFEEQKLCNKEMLMFLHQEMLSRK